jgi:hypothetical protein
MKVQKEKPSFWKKLGVAFAKLITNISLVLAIFFIIIAIFFLLVSGGSLLTAYLIYQKHPVVIFIAIVLTAWIGVTLPASITSLLIPEAVVSKVTGGLGVTTDVASALVLLIILAFFSAIGAIISLILALIFLCIALLFKKISGKQKGILLFIAGVLCLILFVWFLITLFLLKGIVFLMFISLILSLIFLSVGVGLLFPYLKEWFNFLKKK